MNTFHKNSVLYILSACLSLSQSTLAQNPRLPYTPTTILPPARKAAQVKLIKGPALELFRNNEAIIRWTSTNPGGSDEHWALIKYGTDPKNLNETAKSHIRLNRARPDTIFRVRVGNLNPGTTYYYTVASMNADGTEDALKSGTYHFTAARAAWINAQFASGAR
jgi:hypothetical protein